MSKILKTVNAVNDLPGGCKLPAYQFWNDMHNRCYSTKLLQRRPTYVGTSVSDEWKKLSNFNDYFNEYYQYGFQLDKDLILIGNRIYCPEYAVFVPSYVNIAVVNKKAVGLLGAFNSGKRYRSLISIDNKLTHLGTFDTAYEAHNAWRQQKVVVLNNVAKRYKLEAIKYDSRVYDALVMRSDLINDDIKNNRVTCKF